MRSRSDCSSKPYDRDGLIAASGTVLDSVVAEILRAPFFLRKPPKTAGREEFGREFVQQFMKRCGRARKAGHRRHGNSPDSALNR